jgi:transcriptional regulator with XRE-family HTH domain
VNGKELRVIRKELGLTQAALADLVGVASNTIARQERGEMGIKEPLARLLKLLVAQHHYAARGKARSSRGRR